MTACEEGAVGRRSHHYKRLNHAGGSSKDVEQCKVAILLLMRSYDCFACKPLSPDCWRRYSLRRAPSQWPTSHYAHQIASGLCRRMDVREHHPELPAGGPSSQWSNAARSRGIVISYEIDKISSQSRINPSIIP